MVLMAADGLRNDQIAARLRCGRDVVSQWRKRFFEQRLAGLEDRPGAVGRRLFPPQVRAEVIRLACERPADSEVPLARWSSAELAREVVARGICEQISGDDGLAVALRGRDQAVAVPLLDLPARPRLHRQGRPDPRPLRGPVGRRAAASRRLRRLLRREALDPSPAPQAPHAARPAAVERGQRVEHEYERRGALCYFAAWDARRAKLFDRCDRRTGSSRSTSSSSSS